jgi:hypothetical protein
VWRERGVVGSEGQSGTVGGFWGSDFGCLATSGSEIFSLWPRATRNCVDAEVGRTAVQDVVPCVSLQGQEVIVRAVRLDIQLARVPLTNWLLL